MANQLYYPKLNPVPFFERGLAPLPQYYHKYDDDYQFENTIQHPATEKVSYKQKWQNNDIIFLQFESNFSSISIDLTDKWGQVVNSFNAVQKRINKYVAGFYAYEISISLTGLPEGLYQLIKKAGDIELESVWLFIRPSWPNTILFEYRNSRYHGEVLFETGITFSIRLEGTIGRPQFGSHDTFYEDQPANPYILSSKSFKGYKLIIGGERGLPPWAEEKFHLIWTCNDVKADGKPLAKLGDSKATVKEEEHYPMAGIELFVREGINRGSKITEPGLATGKKVVLINPVDASVFGDLNLGGSSNIILIQSNE